MCHNLNAMTFMTPSARGAQSDAYPFTTPTRIALRLVTPGRRSDGRLETLRS